MLDLHVLEGFFEGSGRRGRRGGGGGAEEAVGGGGEWLDYGGGVVFGNGRRIEVIGLVIF